MTPDIEQQLVLLGGTLAAILEMLRRLWKRKRNVRLALTLSVTEENSEDSHPSTKQSLGNGRKTDSSDAEQQREKQQRSD